MKAAALEGMWNLMSLIQQFQNGGYLSKSFSCNNSKITHTRKSLSPSGKIVSIKHILALAVSVLMTATVITTSCFSHFSVRNYRGNFFIKNDKNNFWTCIIMFDQTSKSVRILKKPKYIIFLLFNTTY